MTQHFYVTTPIYYVNDRPHIGHAYTTIAADVVARYKRLQGFKVKFLTGTDEHGQKVEKSAQSQAIDPQAFTDQNAQYFRDLTQTIHSSNDDFIRTSEMRHKKGAQHFWQVLKSNSFIYEGSYSGWYSVRDECYYMESELIEGKAPTGAPVEWIEEPSYFFKLSAFTERLLAFYKEHPDFIAPKSRYNEVVSFVEQGLKDLSISRTSFSWGITVPDDEKHVMYVWLDALTNYLTALGYPEDTKEFSDYWPADIHIVGKDILRFHAIFWPAFLMAAELPIPTKIVAHGWWTNEGEKISKSIGNVIDPVELIDTFGVDPVRYFLLREVPFGNDGNFSRMALIDRLNGELANNLGNLMQRSLSMVYKQCDATIPSAGNHTQDLALLAHAYVTLLPAIEKSMEKLHFSEVLKEIFTLADHANSYIDKEAPWALKKTDPSRMQEVLYTVLEVVRILAITLQPFMPDAAAHMLDQLKVSEDERNFSHINQDYALKAGTRIDKPAGVFPRYITPETQVS